MIGQDRDQVARREPILECAPPAGLEDLAVLLEEHIFQSPVEAEEPEEGLREDVPLADVELLMLA